MATQQPSGYRSPGAPRSLLPGQRQPWEPEKNTLGVPGRAKNKPPLCGKWPPIMGGNFRSRGEPYLQ